MGPAPLVLLAAGLAGAATLAAEMLWIRGMGRGVGTTYEAVALVAGLFLSGLGLGALWGGRTAPHAGQPARRGAWLLAAAGTWTELSPLYLAAVPDLRASLFAPDGGGLLPPLLLALPVVVPAALCLGALFPYLVRTRVADVAHAGSRTGGVYAANTLGAVAGLLVLLPLVEASGETLALRLAGAAAWLGTLVLLLADRPLPHGSGPPVPVTPGETPTAGGLGPALFVAGAAALLAQMAWLRMLQPLAGAHLHGVVLLLAPLLLALAVGAALSGPLADRVLRSARLVPGLLAAAGALLLLSLPTAGGAPLRVLLGAAEGGSRVRALVLAFVLTVAPASLVLGALLPAAVRLRAAWSGSTSGPAGRLYGWNALGALAGSLLAGYVLLPEFGAERTLFVAATLVVGAAVVLRWRVPAGPRVTSAVLHALPLLVLLWPGLLAAWLGSGPTTPEVIAARKPLPPGLTLASREDLDLYARWFAGRRAQRPGRMDGSFLPTFEGRGGRIVLLEEPDGRIGLRRGALRESVFDADRTDVPARTEYALGLLPALLHPNPERALVIGHGAGWTAEAVLAAGVGHVEVAEIDPAVLDAARAVRGLAQLPVEADPRAELRNADGRTLLRAAARGTDAGRYDVIASQPSHPWDPASGHLFTVGAYTSAREALRAGGVHAQWLNLFDMTPALLESALASFHAVFPRTWVFTFPDEIVLLGFRDTPQVVPARWDAFFAAGNERASAARAAGFGSAGALWKHWSLDAEGLARRIPPGTEVLQDDVPRLELELARRRLHAMPPEDVERLIREPLPPDLARVVADDTVRERWVAEAVEAWLEEGAATDAVRWTSVPRWGQSGPGVKLTTRAALAAGDTQRAETTLVAANAPASGDGELALLWIRTVTQRLGEGSPQEQQRRLSTTQGLAGTMADRGDVLAALAVLQRSIGHSAEARDLFERAMKARHPEPPEGARYQFARLLLSEAYAPEDEQRARELIAADPVTYTDVQALDLLLRLTSAAGDEKTAVALEASLATLQRARGLALLRRASDSLARHMFADALEGARACTALWATEAEPFELHALCALAAAASEPPSDPLRATRLQEAVRAFGQAIRRSRDPRAARGRADRVLGWFGLDPARASGRPDEDAE